MPNPTTTVRVNWARKPAFVDYLLSLAPVSYWRLDETAGVLALDRSGGNDGTYTNSPTLGVAGLLTGDTNAGVSFASASSQYITVASATNLGVGDVFSFACAIKRSATGTKHYVCQKGTASPGIYVSAADALTLEKVGTADIVASTTTLDTAAHFCVVTKSGSTVALYIDGVDVTGTITNQTTANTASAFEWGRSAVPGNYMNGTLDELAVFNVALTPAQVSRLYAAFAQGEFGGAIDDVSTKTRTLEISGGRSEDYSQDQVGSCRLACDNQSDFFTMGRNLVTNPSFETGLNDWNSGALASVTAAATALNWVKDAPSGAGSYCAQASLSSTLNSGIYASVEGTFRSGVVVSYSISLRSVSGTTSVQIGMASSGTPADINTSGSTTITTSWATYSGTWTPTADRTDAVIFVRTRTAAAAAVKIDATQVNIGATANAYTEAPTRPMLTPGAPLHVYATSSGTNYPLFAGFVERLTPAPETFEIGLLAYDALRLLAVPVDATISNATDYTARYTILDEAIRNVTGAVENMCINGSFETDATAWQGGSRTNAVTAQDGSYEYRVLGTATYTSPAFVSFTAGRAYTLSFYARLVGSADVLTVRWGDTYSLPGNFVSLATGQGTPASLSSSWQRYSLTWIAGATATPGTATFATGANGAYIDAVMIVPGYVVPAYANYGSPSGRLRNYAAPWLTTEAGALFDRGWSNLCTNPEAATNTTGWSTAAGPFMKLPPGGQVTPPGTLISDWSDTDSQTYTTAIYAFENSVGYLLDVTNSHATNAQTITISGGGLTWVSMATVQFSGTTRRLTRFRALVTSGASSGALTITVAGTANTGCGWVLHGFGGVATTGTNGSDAFAAAVTGAGSAVTQLTVTAGTAARAGDVMLATFAADTNTTITPVGVFAGLIRRSGTAPAGSIQAQWCDLANVVATANFAAAAAAAAIICEIKAATGGTLSRVTVGGYGGRFATAFSVPGSAAGTHVYFAFTGTFRSGHLYTFSLYVSSLQGGVGSGAHWKFGALSLAAGDLGYLTISAPIDSSATNQRLTFAWRPSADRTDVVLVLKLGVYYGTSQGALVFSGVMVNAGGLLTYARTGIASPSALTEVDTITSVATGVSHSNSTQFVTYATAGSGVILKLLNLQAFTGAAVTAVLSMKAASGTPSIAIGIANPWGTAAVDLGSKTYTLSTSFSRYRITFTPTRNDFTPGDTLVLYLMITTAAVATITVDDIAVTLGTATQPYLDQRAAGVDTAEIDLITSRSVVAQNAIAELAKLNAANLSHHQIAPLMQTPWWQYTSIARQTIVARTSSESYDSLSGDGIQAIEDFELDRAQVANQITVQTAAAIGVASQTRVVASDTTSITRYGLRPLTAGDTDYLNAPSSSDTTAQTVANLLLTRYATPRSRPKMTVQNHWPAMFQRRPDDVITVTYARGGVSSVLYQLLSYRLAVDEAESWTRQDRLEEYITA